MLFEFSLDDEQRKKAKAWYQEHRKVHRGEHFSTQLVVSPTGIGTHARLECTDCPHGDWKLRESKGRLIDISDYEGW